MPLETITILRQSLRREPIRDDIEADVEGPFAIHPALPIALDRFAVTHVPTGYQVLYTAHETTARQARAALLASDLDWTFTDPKAVTPAHRAFGKQLRKQYEGQ